MSRPGLSADQPPTSSASSSTSTTMITCSAPTSTTSPTFLKPSPPKRRYVEVEDVTAEAETEEDEEDEEVDVEVVDVVEAPPPPRPANKRKVYERCTICYEAVTEMAGTVEVNRLLSPACEICITFFRYSVRRPHRRPVCKANGDCCIHYRDRDYCRGCRLRKCIEVGMDERKPPELYP